MNNDGVHNASTIAASTFCTKAIISIVIPCGGHSRESRGERFTVNRMAICQWMCEWWQCQQLQDIEDDVRKMSVALSVSVKKKPVVSLGIPSGSLLGSAHCLISDPLWLSLPSSIFLPISFISSSVQGAGPKWPRPMWQHLPLDPMWSGTPCRCILPTTASC